MKNSLSNDFTKLLLHRFVKNTRERERARAKKWGIWRERKIKWIKKLNIWFKLGVWKMPRKIKWHKRRKQEKVFFYSHHNIKYNDDKDKTDSFMELFGSVYLI